MYPSIQGSWSADAVHGTGGFDRSRRAQDVLPGTRVETNIDGQNAGDDEEEIKN